MEGALFPCRPLTRNAGLLHRLVEIPTNHPVMEEDSGAATGEHENVVLGLAALPPPRSEKFNDISGDIDLARTTILRSREFAFGEATAHGDRRLHEIYVSPGRCNELSFTHPGLQSRLEEDSIQPLGDRSEETRQFLVREVRSLSMNHGGLLRLRELLDRVHTRVVVSDRRGEAGMKNA